MNLGDVADILHAGRLALPEHPAANALDLAFKAMEARAAEIALGTTTPRVMCPMHPAPRPVLDGPWALTVHLIDVHGWGDGS